MNSEIILRDHHLVHDPREVIPTQAAPMETKKLKEGRTIIILQYFAQYVKETIPPHTAFTETELKEKLEQKGIYIKHITIRSRLGSLQALGYVNYGTHTIRGNNTRIECYQHCIGSFISPTPNSTLGPWTGRYDVDINKSSMI